MTGSSSHKLSIPSPTIPKFERKIKNSPVLWAIDTWIVLYCYLIVRFCLPTQFWCPQWQFPAVHFSVSRNRRYYHEPIPHNRAASYLSAVNFHLIWLVWRSLFPNYCWHCGMRGEMGLVSREMRSSRPF